MARLRPIGLSRRANPRPLLSQVEGKRIEKNCDSVADTDKITAKAKPEPATDDEPAESTEESSAEIEISDIKSPMKRTLWTARDLTLEQTEDTAIDGSSKKQKQTATPKKQAQDKVPKPKGRKRIGKRGVRPPSKYPDKHRDDDEGSPLFSKYHKPAKNLYGSAAQSKTRKREKREFSRETDEESEKPPSSSIAKGPEFKNPLSFLDSSLDAFAPASSSRELEADTLYLSDELEGVSRLSSISSSLSVDIPVHVQEEIDRHSGIVRCPVCELPVDPELLKSFKSMDKTSKQLKFCLAHRRKSAEEEWHERRYPTIDWDSFKERIERHIEDLEDILLPENESFYKTSFRSFAEDDEGKGNLRLVLGGTGLEKLSTGYYGARGARNMTEIIVARFAPKIRELSISDSLIRAVGISGYIQAVLVPELTTILVKEDMNVDDEAARKIMEDSMAIGDLLNDQPDDMIEEKNDQPGSMMDSQDEDQYSDILDEN